VNKIDRIVSQINAVELKIGRLQGHLERLSRHREAEMATMSNRGTQYGETWEKMQRLYAHLLRLQRSACHVWWGQQTATWTNEDISRVWLEVVTPFLAGETPNEAQENVAAAEF
jgi:hypothetical protein